MIAVALWSYVTSHDDELPLTKGDVITLLDTNNTEWYFGSRALQSGYFPANHVLRVKGDPKQLVIIDSQKSESDAVPLAKGVSRNAKSVPSANQD